MRLCGTGETPFVYTQIYILSDKTILISKKSETVTHWNIHIYIHEIVNDHKQTNINLYVHKLLVFQDIFSKTEGQTRQKVKHLMQTSNDIPDFINETA